MWCLVVLTKMLLISWAICEINPLPVSGTVKPINPFEVKFFKAEKILTSVLIAQREQEFGGSDSLILV